MFSLNLTDRRKDDVEHLSRHKITTNYAYSVNLVPSLVSLSIKIAKIAVTLLLPKDFLVGLVL